VEQILQKITGTHYTLLAMDFMTIDTLFSKQLYQLLIIELKSRKNFRFDLTENSCREFVKQRIALGSEDFPEKKTLIHDNAPQFTSIDYTWYDIKGVNICTQAPNMNAYVERLIGTIRREALGNFLLISEKQVRTIIQSYVDYYNHQRPHQGINKIPDRAMQESTGEIKKLKILSGLHHHYYRSSA
jgi:putative transposase